MLTDTILKCKGMDALSKSLGLVDAERFIALVSRESFNYTEWQRDLYGDMSLDELFANIQKYKETKAKSKPLEH